ncbi:unnamed protein product, partial [Owenia fusiformis]
MNKIGSTVFELLPGRIYVRTYGRMDGRTDRQTDGGAPYIPPNFLLLTVYIIHFHHVWSVIGEGITNTCIPDLLVASKYAFIQWLYGSTDVAAPISAPMFHIVSIPK